MFKIIRKIFFALATLRIISMAANVADGPIKAILILGLPVLGGRMVFAKDTDDGK